MFLKGFMCGWIGMAAIIGFLVWGMTPHRSGAYIDYDTSWGNASADDPICAASWRLPQS